MVALCLESFHTYRKPLPQFSNLRCPLTAFLDLFMWSQVENALYIRKISWVLGNKPNNPQEFWILILNLTQGEVVQLVWAWISSTIKMSRVSPSSLALYSSLLPLVRQRPSKWAKLKCCHLLDLFQWDLLKILSLWKEKRRQWGLVCQVWKL